VTSVEHDVSVVIPAYNCVDFLPAAIESAMGQTRPPAEIIVVDDGSTDETLAAARSYGSPVRVVDQENAGVSAARNRAIELARGDWIAFLDADDVWRPTKLERQLDAAGRHPDVVCVFSDFRSFGPDRDPRLEQRPDYTSAPDYRTRMLCEYSVLPSTAMVRASALDELRFPVGITDSEDMIFFIELRKRGPFLRVPAPLVDYRILPDSAVRSAGHNLRSVRARHGYLRDHEDEYSEAERREIREHLAEVLIRGHGRALWRDRDPRMARAYRRLFEEVRPADMPVPREFRRRLYPRWMYLVRDLLSS